VGFPLAIGTCYIYRSLASAGELYVNTKEKKMARKTVLVCDMCGTEVGEAKGATMRLTYSDARRGAKQADVCDGCAGKLPGISVARRGRKPKSAAA
jgi:hypothetical protein